MYDDARRVFRDVANKNLDWPEAVWEAWISFEQLHGTVDQIEEALGMRLHILRRRQDRLSLLIALQQLHGERLDGPGRHGVETFPMDARLFGSTRELALELAPEFWKETSAVLT